MGFAMVIEFIEHLKVVTTKDYKTLTSLLFFHAHVLARWQPTLTQESTGGLPATNSLDAGRLEAQDESYVSQVNPYSHVTSSLTRGWVCLLLRGLTFVKLACHTLFNYVGTTDVIIGNHNSVISGSKLVS
jgi:hypothetical protein